MSMVEELLKWSSEQKCKKAVDALSKKGFTAVYCGTKQEACDYIIKEAGEASTIGFGSSMSITDLKVYDKLKETGKKLLNHNLPDLSPEKKLSIIRQQPTCDLFLTGTNALTLTGCLVNIDATGNRVGSMAFCRQPFNLAG